MTPCDQCKKPVPDTFVRILVSEGMGEDPTGTQVESAPGEYLFCSYACVKAFFKGW